MQDCAGAGPFSLPNFRDVGLLFKHYSTVTVVVPSIYGAEDGCDVSLLVDGEGGGGVVLVLQSSRQSDKVHF